MRHEETAVILPADIEHLAGIRDLAHQIWHEHYPGIISREQIDYMLARDYAIESLHHDLENDIAIDRLLIDGELTGFAAYGPWDEAREYKLHKLYLSKSFHGLGLGSMLLRHVEAECRRKGATRLVLSVNKRNTLAIRAYERNGFARRRPVVVDIGGGFVMDDYIMGKELGPGFRRQ